MLFFMKRLKKLQNHYWLQLVCCSKEYQIPENISNKQQVILLEALNSLEKLFWLDYVLDK